MTSDNIEKLVAKAVQGDIGRGEAAALAEACEKDPELARRFRLLVKVDRILPMTASGEDETFVREFRKRIAGEGDSIRFAKQVTGRIRRTRSVVRLFGIAAAVAAVVLPGVFLLKGWNPAVAELVRVEAGDWAPGGREFRVGDSLSPGSGLVELHYRAGVTLLIEAPAHFEITGGKSGYLHHGKLVAEVDDSRARGFTIDGPSGRLVDLGTKFAVKVESTGEMEVHVIEGIVDATATGGKTERLGKDQAVRLADGTASSLPADAGSFITRMPAYQNQPPQFVRWSFDENGDVPAADTGRGLAGGDATAVPRSFAEGGSLPERIADAPFGNGMRFDGKNGYLESEFRGIGGGKPRTVAFWVRAPADFNRLEGYGIVNWGNLKQDGAAWQISVNPAPEEGPVGCLRIGTQRGHVVGTTDLRDNQWHHCAVVMYGDEEGKPNTATHILLYVDGRLEPAARKSVHAIHTSTTPNPAADDHGIWMGRNLGYEYEGSSSGEIYGKFFRGDIDEMIICDTALNQQQILKLMTENRMP